MLRKSGSGPPMSRQCRQCHYMQFIPLTLAGVLLNGLEQLAQAKLEPLCDADDMSSVGLPFPRSRVPM
jgi:hypothetical protein